MTKWVTKKLGEIGNVAMCKRIFSYETTPEGEVPFYKIGTFGKKADAYISKTKYEEYKNKFSYPKKGDILLSASGTIGRTVVYDGVPAYFQDSNIIWLSHDEKVVLNEFLFYLYKDTTWNLEGSTIARLYNDNFYKIEIPIPIQDDGTPDLAEQRRIAAILGSADKVIATSEALIEKYKHIKQGMLTDLLQPKEGWKKVKLGKCCEDIFSGKNVSRKDFGKYIVYGSTGAIGYSDDYEYDFDAILVARVGANAGLVNKVSGKFDVSDNTLVVKIQKTIDLNYLYYLLVEKDLNQFVFGSGQPLVTAGLLKKLEIFIPFSNDQPDLTEQRRIASILSSIDAKILAEEKVVEKYKGVKKGLMERMMGGSNN